MVSSVQTWSHIQLTGMKADSCGMHKSDVERTIHVRERIMSNVFVAREDIEDVGIDTDCCDAGNIEEGSCVVVSSLLLVYCLEIYQYVLHFVISKG